MSDNFQGRPPEFLPKIITTLRENYRLPNLMRDLLAGLAVAIVALPLSIAIAITALLFRARRKNIEPPDWHTPEV